MTTATAMLNALPGPALLLAAEARLHHANTPALMLLSNHPAFMPGLERVVLRRAADQAALEAALLQATLQPWQAHPVCLTAREGGPVLLLQCALLPGPAALLLVTLHNLAARASTAETLVRHLRLTPAQARATALLAEGLTVPEIAERLGVQTSTVQTQLRQSMVRLGQKTQLRLAIVVAGLVVALGAPGPGAAD